MLAYTFARIRRTVHFRVTKGNHKKKKKNCPRIYRTPMMSWERKGSFHTVTSPSWLLEQLTNT